MRGEDLFRWRPLTADGDLLWLKYSFGPGTANALAARLGTGEWLVVSPPLDAPARVYETLDERGGVRALIAPNAYHSRGQAAWRARFPKAVSYAPTGAHPRLAKVSRGIAYQPLENLSPMIGDAMLLIPDGMKSPDVMFGFPTTNGHVWWMGDLFSNSVRADQIPLLRFISRAFGSGLGYRCSAKPEMVYVRDRSAWLASIRLALADRPPAVVVPAHGDPVTSDAAARTLKAMAAIDT